MGQFKTWRAFWNFDKEVKSERRYIRTKNAEQFLEQVLETCADHILQVDAGHRFFRAQIGNSWSREDASIVEAVPLPSERMVPLRDRAFEGRVNPKGVPCLYLSTTMNAAASEVRPWIGAYVTVAEFEVIETLRIVDCSVGHDNGIVYYSEEPSEEKREAAVWTHLDKAFARPVTRSDDTADYVATQIIAELFRTNGYDGIAYKSPFGDDAYTIALFDIEAAKCGSRDLREVVGATFYFRDEQD